MKIAERALPQIQAHFTPTNSAYPDIVVATTYVSENPAVAHITVGAITQAFTLTEVEGHVEAAW